MAPRTKWGGYTLKGQLGVLFAALAIPLLALQIWWSYHDYRGARERAWDDALAFADAVDLGVRQFVEQSADLLRSSARESGRGWLTSGDCSDEMQSLRELLPFNNVLLIGGGGSVVCSAAPAPTDANALDWPWYDEFKSTGEFTIGLPVEADFTDSWILPLVAPIHDEEDELAGAVVGTIPLLALSRRLGGIRPSEERLTTLATGDRIIIARSQEPERYIGESLPPPTGSDREIAPGRWVAEGPDLAGVPRTWGQVETESGWIVYVGVPDEVVFGPAIREAATHVGGTLLVVLLALGLGAWSYRRIEGSLRALAVKTRASEAGEVASLPPGTPQEIGEVIEQFNESLEARTRAEAAERAARERFQSIFDNAVFGIYVSTAHEEFLQVNPALVKMLGYESEEALLAAGPRSLYPDPSRRDALIRETLDSEETVIPTREIQWLRADRTPIDVRVGGHVRPGPHGEPVFEMIVEDVTEIKRAEDQLRQTQKMEAIGQLAGGVAHDFNNLLTVIGGNVELLEDDLEESDPLRDDLEQISKATRRASSLTHRLLTFSRPGRKGMEVVDVNEVIPDLGTMLRPIIGETVRLETDLAEGPHPVRIDPGELEQVVVNLVLNARDAIGGHGEIVVGSARSRREIDGEVQDGVILSVTDEGVGMDPVTERRIFEPFYSTKPMGEGTGLGLSTVYGIVQRVGGTIDVDTEPGRGTRMEIWLPLVSDVTVGTAEPADLHAPVGHESILVVEDDDLVRAFVGRALTSGGFQVHLTGSGAEALDYLKRREGPVDLVLTDIVMPGLSGPELAERLAVDTPETPVLFMSGYVDNELFSEELMRRPESLLRKPFTLHELQARVRDALDRSAGAPTAT